MTSHAAARLDVRQVSKTFGSTRVLHGVDLLVQPGEIHGLVGQNGSGKSTLIKILTGYHAPDDGGSLSVDGASLRLPVEWHEANRAGIAVVHQDLGLLDDLSVAENICVGGYLVNRFPRHIVWRRQRDAATAVLARLEVDIDPAAPVASLAPSQRAEVAIARAMRDVVPGSGLLILDESTRALGKAERDRFHAIVRRVVDQGTSAVLVSHDLLEVLEATDHVSVLRDGRLVGEALRTTELSEAEVARLMLGRSVSDFDFHGAGIATAKSVPEPVTVITGLSGGKVADLTFTVGAGEVVGLTGLPGNGFEDVPYLISGARAATAGDVTIGQTRLDATKTSLDAFLRAGIALVPERRDSEGLAMELSVQDNLNLPLIRQRGRSWFVGRSWQRDSTTAAVADLDIRPTQPLRLVKELSGGNQQKVLFAKWLSVGPQLLILHEPTQGVDVGARQDLLGAVRRAADRGIGVLLASVEPSDLAAVCDRVLVFDGGSELREVRTKNPDEIVDLVYATNEPLGPPHAV